MGPDLHPGHPADPHGPAGPVLVRWPGPCWVLLIEDTDCTHETHFPDRAGAQAELDDRLAELLIEDLDDALAQLAPPGRADEIAEPGRAGGLGVRCLVDVVTDVPRRGQDAASRLGRSAIYQRPGCCWGLLCRRCGAVRELDELLDGADEACGWTHLDDEAAACAAAAELGAVCADCAAAAALGSHAAPDGALLAELPGLPGPSTFPSFPTSPAFPVTPRLF